MLIGAIGPDPSMPSSSGTWQLRVSNVEIQVESDAKSCLTPPEVEQMSEQVEVESIHSTPSDSTILYEPTPAPAAPEVSFLSPAQQNVRDVMTACAMNFDPGYSTILSSLSLHSDEVHKGLAIKDFSVPEWRDTPIVTEADSFAKLCLDTLWVPYDDMLPLTRLLPMVSASRVVSEVVSGPSAPRTICFGAYIFGNQAGMHNTTPHTWVVRLLCSIVRSVCEDALFTNVFLSLNIPSAPHRDSNNHNDIDNVLIPLSTWTGGELWVSSPRGNTLLEPGSEPGHIHDILPPCLQFNAKRLHAVLPWMGVRFLWGAFHIRDDWRLTPEDASFLECQGFRLSSRTRAAKDPYMQT